MNFRIFEHNEWATLIHPVSGADLTEANFKRRLAKSNRKTFKPITGCKYNHKSLRLSWVPWPSALKRQSKTSMTDGPWFESRPRQNTIQKIIIAKNGIPNSCKVRLN